MYALASIIITVAVLIGYLNHRFIKLQSTIGIMVGAMLLSFILLILHHTGLAPFADKTINAISKINFQDLLLKGMLSFLLFAGSLTIDFNKLKQHKWEIGILASISTIASTILIGVIVYYLLPVLGLHMPFIYCLLFGAVISPTDPIAVLATFKEIGAPKNLEICVAGESLFNDGVAIVIFLTLYQLAFNGAPITFSDVSLLFLKQAIGGIAYGAVIGWITNRLIKSSNDPRIAILITLGTVTGAYSLALALDISGALAMVVAGIFVGNSHRKLREPEDIKTILHTFWEIIDEILNAILFLLIGLELLTIKVGMGEFIAVIAAIPIALLVRLFTVAVPMKFIQLRKERQPLLITILTWGGLRGGLAVALALSLPHSEYRHLILAMTYSVVIFAVIVQGITIKPLAKLAHKYNN